MISNDDYDYLSKKYGNLIKKASYGIYGDLSKSPEDYESDLWAVVLDYLPHFMRKAGITSVRQFCEDPEYSKYVKQWIWTKKLNFITKNGYIHYAFPTNALNSDSANVEISVNDNNRVDVDSIVYDDYTELFLSELKESSDIVDNILYAIAAGPNTVKNNGTLNISRIAKFLNISPEQVKSNLSLIQERFKYAIKN